MLVRLILFLFLVFGVVYGVKRLRNAPKALDESNTGRLTQVEIQEIMHLAKRSDRMEAALITRGKIVERAKQSKLVNKVDQVLRKLATQIKLKEEIAETFREMNADELEDKIAEAQFKVQAAKDADTKHHAEAYLKQLETQDEHLARLKKRRQAINLASERIVNELKNIHLAMLSASSNEASLSSDQLTSAIAHLEEASEDLRRQSEADDEVARMLRSGPQKDKTAS